MATCVMPPKIPRHDAESAATGCRSGMVPGRTVSLTRLAQTRKLFFGIHRSWPNSDEALPFASAKCLEFTSLNTEDNRFTAPYL